MTVLYIIMTRYRPYLHDDSHIRLFNLSGHGLYLLQPDKQGSTVLCFDKFTIQVYYNSFACDFKSVVLIRKLPGTLNSFSLPMTSLFCCVERALWYLLFPKMTSAAAFCIIGLAKIPRIEFLGGVSPVATTGLGIKDFIRNRCTQHRNQHHPSNQVSYIILMVRISPSCQ